MGRVYDHAWRKVRDLVLERDRWVCQISGPKCDGQADCVDHVIPVEDGGARLDPGNLRAACTPCNVARANRQKAREGWRRSRTRVMLVVGPPGAGKSAFVDGRKEPGDLVVDYDLLAGAIGSASSDGATHDAVMAARNALLTKVRRGEVDAPTAWIVSANPNAEDLFPFHEVHVVDPGADEAARGLSGERRRLVDEWYANRRVDNGPSRAWW